MFIVDESQVSTCELGRPLVVRWFREQAEQLSFGSVFAGPLHAAATGRGAGAY